MWHNKDQAVFLILNKDGHTAAQVFVGNADKARRSAERLVARGQVDSFTVEAMPLAVMS